MFKKFFIAALCFAAATILVCIANFILQVIFIFIDLVSRFSSSSAYVIVLWLVTGVFGTVFTHSVAEQFLSKEKNYNQITGRTILIISAIAIILAVLLLVQGHFRSNPEEYSLLFSSGYVFIAYFFGAWCMALISRNLK